MHLVELPLRREGCEGGVARLTCKRRVIKLLLNVENRKIVARANVIKAWKWDM